MGLGGEESKPFRVTIRKEEVVTPLPSSPVTKECWLPMSNLDFLMPQMDVASILFYKKPPPSSGGSYSMIENLKKGLAQVLVPFYPLAGELVQNSQAEPEICCNNRGVGFIEAYADVELQKFNLHDLDQSFLIGNMVPNKKHGILAVQVTELKCGSVVVVCLFDHRFADGYSISYFLLLWSEFTRSEPIIYNRPTFQRSLLKPPHLGYIDSSVQDMYSENLPPTTVKNDHPTVITSRLYYIKAEHINQLQAIARSTNKNITKFESFSAFLWKIIAKISSASNVERLCRMGIAVDGRPSLSNGVGEDDKMKFYVGNVVSTLFWDKKVCDMNKEPLNQVAEEVHKCFKSIPIKEHFLGILDWVEELRSKSGMPKLLISKIGDGGQGILVSSGLRFPFKAMDFGWGKPILGFAHFPVGTTEITNMGYVLPMLSPLDNGDWIVYMQDYTSQLELIQNEASNLLKPLTSDDLFSTMEQNIFKNNYVNINSKI